MNKIKFVNISSYLPLVYVFKIYLLLINVFKELKERFLNSLTEL